MEGQECCIYFCWYKPPIWNTTQRFNNIPMKVWEKVGWYGLVIYAPGFTLWKCKSSCIVLYFTPWWKCNACLTHSFLLDSRRQSLNRWRYTGLVGNLSFDPEMFIIWVSTSRSSPCFTSHLDWEIRGNICKGEAALKILLSRQQHREKRLSLFLQNGFSYSGEWVPPSSSLTAHWNYTLWWSKKTCANTIITVVPHQW